MPQRCIIPGCFGETNRSVFRVPKNIERRDMWLKAVHDVCPNLYVNENFRVCEKHFRKTDFTSFIADKSGKIVQEVTVERKRLKQGAVPYFDVLNLDTGNELTRTILAEQDELRPQRHLEHGLVTLKNSPIKMHTLVKEEIEEDSAALHDDVQFKHEDPDRHRERAPNMQTAIIKTEIEVEPAALHHDIQVKQQGPDCERELAFNMHTAIIKTEIEVELAALHHDIQVKHQGPDREREKSFNMHTAIKSETEEDSAALHDDKQVKPQRPDHNREIARNMQKAIKTEAEEEAAAIHYDDVEFKPERRDREKVRAFNMQIAIKTEIEEDSADLHCDMQCKHEHPDHERDIALNIRTAIKREIEEDSAVLQDDVQFKHEHPDHDTAIARNTPTTIKCEIEEDYAGIYDSVQVKHDRPQHATRFAPISEFYMEHNIKEELGIGPMVLQRPGPSTEQLFTDIKRRRLNKAAVPSIFPWNQVASPNKGEFLTLEDFNSLSDSGPETKNVDLAMELLFGFASSATSVRDTESSAASDLETDYDIPTFNASGIKKTYSKQGGPLPKMSRLKRNNEILKQEKLPEKETDVTFTEENISETLTAEASVDVQSTESAEDKELTAVYKAFTCNDCRKQFKSKPELLQHIKTHNKNISELCFNCTECEYNTVTRDALDRHLKFHDKQRRHVCEKCSFRFNRKDVLQTHIKHCHTVNKTLKSIVLNKSKTCTDDEKTLRNHSGEKPFSCPHCPYKYTEQSHLKRHMRTHTGEKRFSCPQCPYKCALQCVLKNHIRTHTGEKPLSCPLCQFKCIQQCDLKNHIRTHTGEKPFSCSQCPYKCTKRSNLERHILSNHRKM